MYIRNPEVRVKFTRTCFKVQMYIATNRSDVATYKIYVESSGAHAKIHMYIHWKKSRLDFLGWEIPRNV